MVDRRQSNQPEYLLIGEILRPHGVVGELRMRIITDFPERLQQRDTVFLGRGADSAEIKQYHLKGVRIQQNHALVKFEGVVNRNQAELMRGMLVMIPFEEAAPLGEGEHYLYQLIGLDVHTEDGKSLGKVIEIIETGANDVYVTQSEDYGEVLIPATSETILKTDVEAGILTVRLPEGLLPQ